jgi:hypothetical protein
MRYAHRLLGLALALSFPIAACSSGGGDPGGTGGRIDPSTGDFEQDGSVTSTGSGFSTPPGVWTNGYGDAEDQHATALAVNDAGAIAVTGNAKGTIDFGNIPWTGTKTDTDVFVAKLTSEGQALWSRRYGDSCDQRGGAVALTVSGNVLLAGDFCGKMEFGATSVETQGSEIDAFVAMIDTLGQDVYSRSFSGKGAQIVRAAAVDTQGGAVIVGSFDQGFDDGTGEAPSAGLDDAFVIKLDPTGKLLWSQRFGGPASDIPRSVAVDANGTIVVGGSFGGSVDFGGGPLTAGVGHESGFVLVLDPDGHHLWSKSFVTEDDAAVNGVALDSTGNVAATGYFRGTLNLGTGVVTSQGAEDLFFTLLNSGGMPFVGHAIGGPLGQRGTGIAFAKSGELALSGISEGPVALENLGQGLPVNTPLDTIGHAITFAVKYNAFTVPISARELGSPPMESAGVGFDGNLATTLAGSFQERLSSQLLPIHAAGGWDVFVSHDL